MKQSGNHHTAFGVEVAGGFVGNEQLGFVEQRARYGHSLLFAAAQLVRHLIAAVRQSDQFQHLRHALTSLCFASPAGGSQHKVKVLFGRHLLKQLEILEHYTQTPAQHRHIAVAQPNHVKAKHMGFLPRLYRYFGIQALQKGTLAAAHFAQQIHKLALRHAEVDVAQHYSLALSQCNAPVIYHSVGHNS